MPVPDSLSEFVRAKSVFRMNDKESAVRKIVDLCRMGGRKTESVDKPRLQKPSGDARPARSAKSMEEAVPRSLSAKARLPAANDDSAAVVR
jgi:hypothetical protein